MIIFAFQYICTDNDNLKYSMKRFYLFAAVAAILMAAASCSSPEKMAKMAESVQIQCNPQVLEVIDGAIDASVSVTYPKDYFNPKAILEVTPVIVYDGGEAAMRPFMYQGDKVKDNYRVVSSNGQTVTEQVHFDYVEGMEHCYLELRGRVLAGKKSIDLPVARVAEGANTTYMLADRDGRLDFKADNYQDVLSSTAEGQILFQVNSSQVRSSELNSDSVRDFQDALNAAAANDRATITGTEIVAYASPEGSEDLNNQLSANRSNAAAQAWNRVARGVDADDPLIRSVGEDWDGFRELVGNSNIQDKELILRVLSMYSDPAVRESEIRNMSEVFTALKTEILPILRRARLIANVQVQNYTNDELLQMLQDNEEDLDEEALLRVASLVRDAGQKVDIYNKAIERFDSDRARYNLAVVMLGQKRDARAKSLLDALDEDPDVLNARGVLALHQDDIALAESLFRRSGTPAANANMGVVYILTGRYEEAVEALKDTDGCCRNRMLAYILNDQPDQAVAALSCGSAGAMYLRAVAAARLGDEAAVREYLAKAAERDPAYAERALTDVEFAAYEL